jgi:beta-glucosidase
VTEFRLGGVLLGVATAATQIESRRPLLRRAGINYYSRSCVSKIGDAARPGAELSDLGWEISPEGLERVATWAHDRWPAPIWVTENGTADNTERFRTQFLHDHLEIVAAARSTGLPFERFYHWCFVDNWEWAEGEVPRFGIVALDYATQERTVKPSGRFYADVIAAGGVTPEIAARHLSS